MRTAPARSRAGSGCACASDARADANEEVHSTATAGQWHGPIRADSAELQPEPGICNEIVGAVFPAVRLSCRCPGAARVEEQQPLDVVQHAEVHANVATETREP